jgi:hypothetical protein
MNKSVDLINVIISACRYLMRQLSEPRRVTCFLLAICVSGCEGVNSDVEFSRTFLNRLKAGDPSVATEMDSSLLAVAGPWQSVRSTIVARLPPGAVDSIVFVSREKNSSMPRSVRLITVKVFGGRKVSRVEMFLETGKRGQPMLNTIGATGPVDSP